MNCEELSSFFYGDEIHLESWLHVRSTSSRQLLLHPRFLLPIPDSVIVVLQPYILIEHRNNYNPYPGRWHIPVYHNHDFTLLIRIYVYRVRTFFFCEIKGVCDDVCKFKIDCGSDRRLLLILVQDWILSFPPQHSVKKMVRFLFFYDCICLTH